MSLEHCFKDVLPLNYMEDRLWSRKMNETEGTVLTAGAIGL
jgi:hypothetical protein